MAETLDDLTQIYNDVVGIVPPGSPILKDLQAKIAALGVSQAQVTESLIKTKPLITSTSGEVYNEATGTYEKPVSSGKSAWWDPGDWGSSVVDVAEDILPSIDDTFVDTRDFLADNSLEVAALVLTAGGGAVVGLTAGQTAVASTLLTTAAGVDKGESVPEAFVKTVLTAGAGDLISGASDVVAPVIANSINVSEDMIKLATNTAISVGFSGGDLKTAIIATAGSAVYNTASSTITNKLKNTIDLPDIKLIKSEMLLVMA